MAASAPRISFVSLGCPKALVDSERIITRLRAEGYELARGHSGADLAIVNTCGFLDSAQTESLAAIGEALAKSLSEIPARRLGTKEEFGQLCAFLASQHAGYITGRNFLVDGGLFPGAF